MKLRSSRKLYGKYKLIILVFIGLLIAVLIARYYSSKTQTLASPEHQNLGVQLLDHEPLTLKGSLYTQRDGTRIDLLQRDTEGHGKLLIRGAGDEFDTEAYVEPVSRELIHQENDHTKLIISPDNNFALFSREKGRNELFAIDTVQNQVYKLTDTNVSDSLSAVIRGDSEGAGWIDNYFVYLADKYNQTNQYGAVELLSLDIKNKQLYKLDKSTSDPKANPFLKEVWQLKVCGKQIVYSRGWQIGYKQPRTENHDRHGYLVVTSANGDNRRIIKKTSYLSGTPKATCSY